MNTWKRTATIAIVFASGCSGGGSGDDAPLNTDYSALRIPASTDAALVRANDAQLLGLLRNGVRLATYGSPEVIAATPPSFSITTTQVSGVDEADYTKYDGAVIYSVQRDFGPADEPRYVLRTFETDATTASIEPLASVILNQSPFARPTLYLQGAQGDGGPTVAAAVLSSEPEVRIAATGPAAILPFVPTGSTILRLFDVRDPSLPRSRWKLELSGELRASRKIGSTLYVMTVFYPSLPGLALPANSDAQRQANERAIRAAGATSLLPLYREDGGAGQALVRPGDCFVTQQVDANDGYRALVTVTAIDLAARRVTDVACLSTNVAGTYVSEKSLYVGGYGVRPDDGSTFTVVHKFALDGGRIRYEATGAVPGQLTWQNASYYMDEYRDDLRIVTTIGLDTHRLSILRAGDRNRLETIATLPNAQRPTPIGKPNERLFASRFVGDRAYLVTFRFTDPLYALDLSNPTDPRIAGSLEIPGFSSYLQPLGPPGGELLLSVGQIGQGPSQGVKVELFDVRDIAQPRSIGSHLIGVAGSSSEVISDPHALTTLALGVNGSTVRAALPATVNKVGGNGVSPYTWDYSGVHFFEIAGVGSATPTFAFKGAVETARATEEQRYPLSYGPSRGLLHDNSVFAIQDNKAIAKRWADIAN